MHDFSEKCTESAVSVVLNSLRMADPDFEEQLRQENLEQAEKEGSYGTYTDADGTVFEWDSEKKAYFPKIDDDFIAKYQMNYGQSSEQETGKEGTTSDDTKTEEEKRKEYEQYCKDYYNYYYSNQTTGENGEGGDNSSKGDNSKDGEYSYEDYMAYCNYYYGDNYGEGQEENVAKEEEKEDVKDEKTQSEKEKSGDKKKSKPDQGWFDHDSEKSTHVYVSGLPLDITADEYQELMSKYGLIMYDPHTRKPKLKLYRDEMGQPKGDGLCCYIKQESVDLALNILDGSDVRGHKVSVERAQFQMKGQYDPGKKRKKLSNKDKRKIKEKQAKLFDWRPEKAEGRMKCEKTVVLKNMFDPQEFEENPMIINELRVDVRAEASKFGDVKKVTVYDRHVDGVITVRYKEAEEADLCISSLNGRWFAKRRIIAQTWDGKTKYEVEETEEEREARLNKWQTFLEKAENTSGAASASAATSSVPAVSSSVPAASSSVPAASSSESLVKSTEPMMASSEPAVASSEPAVASSEPAVASSDSAVASAPVSTSPESIVSADVSVSSATPSGAVTVASDSDPGVNERKEESALVEGDVSKEKSS